jgi:hypothetical protein
MCLAGSRGEFPYDEGKHLIVVLDEFFYGDDAGTHTTAAYCLVGGYKASPRQWKKFREEWQDALKRAGVPEFHANVFFNRKVNRDPRENPYLKWSDAKAIEFRRDLLDIIHKRAIHPLGCAVSVPAFKALTYGEQCALSGQVTPKGRRSPSPYLFAFAAMLTMALSDVQPDTKLHFRFGLQPERQGQAISLFNLLRGAPAFIEKANQLASIEFATSEAGLQAADLYVHAWYNTLVRSGRLNQENMQTMNALTRKAPTVGVADATTFDRMFNSLPPDVRQHFRSLTPRVQRGRRS